MKRLFIWIISIIIGLIVVVSGFIAWLTGTNQGTRWFVEKVIQTLPVKVTTGRIEGTLFSGLTLAGVGLDFPSGNITVEKAAFSIQPLYLLGGHLGINDLQLQNVTLLDKSAAKPFDFVWPRLPRSLLSLSAGIRDLRISNFVYRNPAEELIRIGVFRARANWRFGTLYLKDIDLQSSWGDIAGSAAAGFGKPFVSGDLRLLLKSPVFDHGRFDLQMKAAKPAAGEQVASSINLTAYLKKEEHLQAQGVIGLKRTGILFHDLQIRELLRRGFLAADGELIPAGGDSHFDLQLQIHDLGLKKDVPAAATSERKAAPKNDGSSFGERLTKIRESLLPKKSQPAAKGKIPAGQTPDTAAVSGIVAVKGNIRNYNGNFSLRQKSAALPWMSGQIKGQITGNEQGIRLQNITGDILGGSLTGSLDWTWQDKNRISWILQGRNLDPARIGREWEGVVNADVRGSLAWNEATPLAGTVNLNLIKSILNKRTLAGGVEVRFEQGAINFLQGDLRGKGFRVSVKGNPANTLDYRINVEDLSVLIPGVHGQINAGGWIRWKKEEITGLLQGSGTYPLDDKTVIRTPRTKLQWTWNEKGLVTSWDVALDPSGRITGSFISAEPFRLALPQEGALKASWHSVDPGIMKRWYDNKSIKVQGRLNGELRGNLRKDGAATAEGTIAVTDGGLSWETGSGLIKTAIRQATVHFKWENDAVKGDLSIQLTDYGRLDGDFQLPLLSRFPLQMSPAGAVRGQIKGALREKGVMTAIFPGSVSESHGNVQFQVTAGGTWEKPDFRGLAKLEKAGAYFPQIGIRLENAGAEAEWVADQINVRAFHFRYGSSELHGSAMLWIADRKISRYEGTIAGENVQAVYLPEIRIWASPDLQFKGDLKKMFLRGSVRIPEALFSYSGKAGVVSASPDVVIVDQPKKKEAASSRFIFDTNVSVLLGDKFRVEAGGLHAGLGGKVTIMGESLDNLLMDGQIAIVKGYYEHYGVKLDITRGRAVFKKEPADRGSLDILALKKIRDTQKRIDVQAGVTITGTIGSPLVKLYGRPAMSDRDALSYMVIGQPYSEGTGSSQKEQMAKWAAALLASGSPSSFTRKVKERLGIDVIGVETDSTGKAGVATSLITVGKYLSPDLYVAFGRSVFGDDYYLSARYSFLKNWQVESKVGMKSAADIFYRIEFD